ncbi:probable pectinesterase 67 [Daucus carota subsp. sativus]|nr:PREDICTED: probable pectinesterase 67 [Daucus carota subsp. sativus]
MQHFNQFHLPPTNKMSSSSCLQDKSLISRTLYFLLAITFISSFDVVAGSPPPKPNIVDASVLTQKINTNRTIKVALEGTDGFKSIQAAIDSVPDGNTNWVIIHVRQGVYREKVTIPEKKPFIFLRGNGKGKTAIRWSQSSVDNTESAILKVNAHHVVVFGLSIKNDAPTGVAMTSQNQSVAAMVAGDMVAFYHCAFHSTHNTLFDYKGRHYYDTCYIQGSIDFIFGRAQSVYHDCEIFVVEDKRVEIHGSITAQNRPAANEDSGFVFLYGKVYGVGEVYLGRAKGAFSRVVFVKTYISNTIVPEGWSLWRYEDGSTENLYQAEYKCYGPGAPTTKRAKWAKQLNDKEVAPFLSIDFIKGKDWLPAWS